MTLYDRLLDLAHNLRWDWDGPTRQLFRDLDPGLWERVGHNPVALLRRLDPETLEGRPGLEERVAEREADLASYLEGEPWSRGELLPEHSRVAYFSAEFGLTECLRIYSGGLGVLAGDHLKSASDLGIPLVAVGLLYREGYFRQELDAAGGQRASYPVADFEDLPVRPVQRPDGTPARVSLSFPGRRVVARVWRADVGRVPLFLLDTDDPENSAEDRRITARLYGGGNERRISQEIVLGVGGYRALAELGIRPAAYHMNEGHSAFLSLELVRDLMVAEELEFEDAVQAARARSVFTTHTPVPAGHDRFPPELMERYMTATAHGLGLDLDDLMDLGRTAPGADEPFTMTILALRLAARTNGVSALHGRVSREMWHDLWPEGRVEDVPIDHITNGVHLPTWVHPAVEATYGVPAAELGLDGRQPDPDPAALWPIRQERRRALVEYVRERTGARLDPDALTIAFARRFATYKRATLLLSDLDRLERLVASEDRPVQVVFSGKAHPRDEGGQALIRRIGEVARMESFRDRIVFLPGYDIDVGRALVQGADVWLNNPRRPMEASGTSGMKAAANGVLNVSILDGWWDEAWRDRDPEAPAPGWVIGTEETEAVKRSRQAIDKADTHSLYRVLEEEVVPAFYDRDEAGVPRGWTTRMRESIRQVAPYFTTHRMLREYADRYQEAARPEATRR